jgi:polyhydroxyalkanoate synthesis regulator phasin
MLELLRKGIVTGVGLGVMTKSKIENLVSKITEEAKLTEKEGEKLLSELLVQSEEARSNIEKEVKKQVELVLNKLDIPSKKDIDDIKKEISEIKANK